MSGRSRSPRPSSRSNAENNCADSASTPIDSTSAKSLSQRIWGWTNNLIATSVVLVIAVTFGWQAISSWHSVRPEPRSSSVVERSSSLSSAVSWSLGEGSGRWSREELQATRPQAHAYLIQQLKQQFELSDDGAGYSSPQTDRLLAELLKKPAQWESPQGVVYLQDGPIPLALAARKLQGEDALSPTTLQVVAWGLALPGPAPESDLGSERQPYGSVEPRSDDSMTIDSMTVDSMPMEPEPDPATHPESSQSIERSQLWVITLCRPSGPSRPSSPAEDSESIRFPDQIEITFAVDDPRGGKMIGFRTELSDRSFQTTIDQMIRDQRGSELRWIIDGDQISGASLDDSELVIQATRSDGTLTGVWTENPRQ